MNVSMCMPVLYSLDGISQIPALRLKDLCGRGGSEIGRMSSSVSFPTTTFSKHNRKDAGIMVTCTRPTQGQSKHTPTRRMGRGHDMLPQDEELLVFDCYLESERQGFFFFH